jgi:hypothetical protein
MYFQICEMNHSVIHAVERLSLDASYNTTAPETQPHSLTNITLTQDDEIDDDGSESGT